MTEKVLCPYCGAEMHDYEEHLWSGWVGAMLCPDKSCRSNSPLVKGYKTKAEARAAALAAAKARYLPPNRPLALENAGALPRMVWLEVRGSPGKAQPSILMDTGRPICHLQLYGRWYNEYGRTWRMWPQQPTAEEMENTPWEDEACCTN